MKNWVLYFLIPVTLLYFASKISKSNSAYVYYVQTPEYDGGDLVAIKKLNELVEENFLNRSYYEGVAYTDESNRWYANYNKEYKALLIGGSSGWSYYFYATPEELKMIADRKIRAIDIDKYLRPFPVSKLEECPTRSRDLISFF
ncbi:hypothetical protein [Dyadobacter pollutisoli]|uniref:Uncharacterized protein n=1 Tax=Dyadobacter pollutisoli TaxID=2910158 RepID=A0A9E8SLZ5_9BACT|nr:hypothetical protein [Dyadobacter pollutisoli]WAC14175.1 hypothetical protein ON006_09495 [Dyadobacter pollutisoli]